MRDDIVVSVIMTAFNASAFIDEAVNSVLRQSYSQWELIIVQNGSTDDTKARLEAYDDNRIRVIDLEYNIGRVAALNKGCKEAIGKYIAILDADDLAKETRFKKQVEFLEEHSDFGLVCSSCELIDDKGRKLKEYRPTCFPNLLNEELAWTMPVVHSTVMVPKKILVDECGCYPLDLSIGHDWYVIAKIAKKYPVSSMDEILGSWRRYPQSVTGSSKNHLDGRLQAVKVLQFSRSLVSSQDGIKKNNLAIAVNTMSGSLLSLRRGRFFFAFKLFFQAFLRSPKCLWDNGVVLRLCMRANKHIGG